MHMAISSRKQFLKSRTPIRFCNRHQLIMRCRLNVSQVQAGRVCRPACAMTWPRSVHIPESDPEPSYLKMPYSSIRNPPSPIHNTLDSAAPEILGAQVFVNVKHASIDGKRDSQRGLKSLLLDQPYQVTRHSDSNLGKSTPEALHEVLVQVHLAPTCDIGTVNVLQVDQSRIQNDLLILEDPRLELLVGPIVRLCARVVAGSTEGRTELQPLRVRALNDLLRSVSHTHYRVITPVRTSAVSADQVRFLNLVLACGCEISADPASRRPHHSGPPEYRP